MNRSRVINAGSNWLAFSAALVVALLLTPHLIRALGTARYDVWCVVEAVLAYFTLLDLGVGVGLLRASARSRQSPGELNRIASASLVIFTMAALVAMLVGVPLTLLLAPRLNGIETAEVVPFMLLMVFNVAITLPLSVFGTIVEGREAFVRKSIIRLVALGVKASAYLIVTWDGGTLLPLAIISVVVTCLESLALWALCRRLVPTLRFSMAGVDRATLREIRGQSWHAFLAMLAGRITLQTGAIVIGLMLPTGLVTAYATAARLVDYAKTLLRTVTATLTPGIAAMEAAGDWAGIRKLTLSTTTLTLALALPINLGVIFFGQPFLSRWVGIEISERASPALMILSITLAVGVMQSVASRVLYGLGRLKWFARFALFESVLNVGLTLLLVTRYELPGVAWAVTIPNLLFCMATIVLACRAVGIDLKSYLASLVRPVVACVVPWLVWSLWGPCPAEYAPIMFRAGVGYGLSLMVMVTLSTGGRRTQSRSFALIRSRLSVERIPLPSASLPPRERKI